MYSSNNVFFQISYTHFGQECADYSVLYGNIR